MNITLSDGEFQSIASSINSSRNILRKIKSDVGWLEQHLFALEHALKELKNCNIVKVEKKGKQRIYNLSKTIIPILKLIECHGEECVKCRGCRE